MQSHQELPLSLPDEIWMKILLNLPEIDKLTIRSVCKKIKSLAEARGSWDALFLTTTEVIDIPELIKVILTKQFQQKEMTPIQYKKSIEQIDELKKMLLVSDESYKLLKNTADENKDSFRQKFLLKGGCSTVLHCIGVLGSVIVTIYYILTIFASRSQPSQIALAPVCEFDQQQERNCQVLITEALQKTMLMYFMMGGSFGFLLKLIDNCLSEKTMEAGFAFLLPSSNSGTTVSIKENFRRLSWQAFQLRDSIAFSFGAVLSIALISLDPFQSHIKNYTSQDGGKLKIDQPRLSADLATKTRHIGGISIADGFVVLYSFVSVCMLVFKLTKKSVINNCNSFHRTQHENTNEQKPFINEMFKKNMN